MDLLLRPVTVGDEELLYQVYAAVRREEVAAWGWDGARQQDFLRMQFTAQCGGYHAAFPGADHRVILQDGEAVGRIMVHRAEDHIQLVDIAVLPAYRNRGIGTCLIRRLMTEAGSFRRPLRLQVATGNRAARLYERLGFSCTGEDGVYRKMEWSSGPGADGPPA